MPKRSSKPPEDENEIAARITDAISGELGQADKNPAAVALGRLGGLKGGKARAKKLSAARRAAIAKRAAKARWAKIKKA